MKKKQDGPLTPQDYMEINERLRDLSNLQNDIARAKAAGIQCDENDQHCQYLINELTKIKATYFPDKP